MIDPDRSSPTKVVHLFGTMDRGGAELRTIETAKQLDHDMFSMVYVTLSGREGALAEQIKNEGGSVVPMRLGPSFVWRFPRLLRKLGIDTVDSHVATFSGAMLVLAAVAGVGNRIAHFHSDGDQQANTIRRRIQRVAMRALIDRSATTIIGVSPGSLEYGWRPGWEDDPRCRIVPEGIDTANLPEIDERAAIRSALGIAESATVICHVGKADANKNRARAIQVAAELSCRGHDVALLLVGPTTESENETLRAMVQSSGSPFQAHILGIRDDVMCILAASDATLLTSYQEGLPGVVLESLAVGTPVVATDLPGCRYIASHTDGVTLQALACPDEVWADALERSVRHGTDDTARTALRASFQSSPFRLAEAAVGLGNIWAGHSPAVDTVTNA